MLVTYILPIKYPQVVSNACYGVNSYDVMEWIYNIGNLKVRTFASFYRKQRFVIAALYILLITLYYNERKRNSAAPHILPLYLTRMPVRLLLRKNYCCLGCYTGGWRCKKQ